MDQTQIDYITAGDAWIQRIAEEWGETASRHMHIADGFSILALYNGKPIGLLSVECRKLPPPLMGLYEGYIDIVDVLAEFRRQGIATRMVEISAEEARKRGVYQLRAWSSADKMEAIAMWKVLGFGLCPATTHPKGQEVNGYFVTKVLY